MVFDPLTVGTTVALKQAVTHFTKKLLEKNWTNDLLDGKEILQQLSENGAAERYVEKYVSKHLRMRTLHSPESDVYLDEVYTPLTLRVTSNNDELRVDDGFTLEFSKVINIIGIAGQGKSTILRKLFLEEIKKQKKFPFFIELRRVDKSGILSYLKSNLEDIGLNVEEDALKILLQSNNIILLLDGFDEISNENRRSILNEIISIKNRFNCSVIVTSRPDTEICHETNITNLKVRHLGQNEIIDIINRLDSNKECTEVIELIKQNDDLRSTLITPILVNLLYVCYPYLDVVPESVVDFYNKLFLTLYSRHDKIKNFNREKYSSISATTANDIFDALCFNSLNKDILEFDERSLVDQLTSALKLIGVDRDQLENIKQDIINITCLIQKDGFDRYVYLHKSVQEFHAAKFISNLPHEHKKKFYNKISSIIEESDKYDNVVSFLREIDKNDFEYLLLIEHFEKYNLKYVSGENKEQTINSIIDSIFKGKEIHMAFGVNDTTGVNTSFSSLSFKNALSAIALFSGKGRFGADDIDYALLEKIKLDDNIHGVHSELHRDFVESIATTKKDVDLEGEGFNPESEADLEPKVRYTVPMKEVLIELDHYNEIANLVEASILTFYNDVYLPILKRTDEVSEILDLDFNV
ncbi:NACHT domain-containing protein [Vibrio sp. Vb2424]|uniref:NACHT domain-containing protein n=1 Tax=Vibrio sp. Vb2424 TaxID=2816074 RepID=UPI001A8F96AC|nr:NACHT domain-containing protein [Vibrio sp. Vb2424]EGQ9110194.1 NACHT domain-containing protein [Vibrio alginolyticus]MBO0148037.1 NACHT domain-containing protein [Vibrio sp. Vb2424]